jgi:hypothetical protein
MSHCSVQGVSEAVSIPPQLNIFRREAKLWYLAQGLKSTLSVRWGQDTVRVIAAYDEAGYTIQYGDDVEAKLEAVAEEVHNELVMQRLGKEYLEEL